MTADALLRHACAFIVSRLTRCSWHKEDTQKGKKKFKNNKRSKKCNKEMNLWKWKK